MISKLEIGEFKQIDHDVLRVIYKDENGQLFTIIIDPWSDVNTPIFVKHSTIKRGVSHVSYGPWNDSNYEKISNGIEEACEKIPSIQNTLGVKKPVAESVFIAQTADPGKDYGLTNSFHGRMTRPLSTAKPEIRLPYRRPSIASPRVPK